MNPQTCILNPPQPQIEPRKLNHHHGGLVVLLAMAEEMEKAKLFDFNLTLPIIMGEFLLLMVALDAIWFKPLGKFMDDQDEAIRQKLLSVRDNSGEIKKLQEEAKVVLKAARVEVSAKLN